MKKTILLLMFPLFVAAQFPAPDSIYDDQGKIRYLMENDTAPKFQSTFNAVVRNINDSVSTKEELVDSIIAAFNSVDTLTFNEQSEAAAWLKWKVFADSTNHAISIHMDAEGVTLQVGFEMYLYGRNVSGSEMSNFTAARITGSTGEWPNMDICGIGSVDSACFAGLATHAIPANEFGFFTTMGISRDGNSSHLSQGEHFYLSYAGALSNDTVDYPLQMVKVGDCIRSHISAGSLLIRTAKTSLNHPTGSVLFMNGNREVADDDDFQFDGDTLYSKVIEDQNGVIVSYDRDSTEAYLIDSSYINNVQNLGLGYGILTQVEDTAKAKSIVAGTNITISADANEITINSTASGGETDYIERNFNDTLLFDYPLIALNRNVLTEDITLVRSTTDQIRTSTIMGQTIGGSSGYTLGVEDPIKLKTSADTVDRAENVVTLWILTKQDLWYYFSVIKRDTADLLNPTIDSIWIEPFGTDTSIVYMLASEVLNSDSIPLITDFSITTTGSQTLSSITTVSDTVKLDFDSNFSPDDTVVIAYTLPDSAGFEDLAENKLQSFSNDTASNNISTIPSDMSLWLPLNGDTDDYSGNGYNATNNGATSTDDYYTFVAADPDYMTVADNNDLDFPGDFSFTMQVYLNSTSAYHLLLAKNVFGANTFEWRINNTNVVSALINGSATENTITGTTTLSASVWYSLAIVRESGTVTLYINGATDGTPKSISGDLTNANELAIGIRSSNLTLPANARFRKIRIYKRALTQSEITNIANE